MSQIQRTTALKWAAIDQFFRHGLLFAISVAMARMVAPEAYGTIALLHFFTAVAGVFTDGGLSSALIQRQNATHIDESTVFWYNLMAGAAMGTLLFVLAPWIASFYAVAILTPIAQLFSLQFLLGSLNSVQNALFQKRLDFKTPLKVGTIAAGGSAVIGLGLAWFDYGIWALVGHSISVAVLTTAFTWHFSTWRPLFVFSLSSFRSLFRYSGYLLLSGLLDTAYNRGYALIIGKLFGVRELGIYYRADALKQLPAQSLAGIISKVAFPLFSRAADDRERLRRGLRKSVRGAMFVNVPLMLGIAAVADPLIMTLFGVPWRECVPLLQILALAGICWPLHVLNLNALKAMGHSGRFFRVELVKKAVGLSLVIGGSRFGIEGMAIAVVISSLFAFIFNAYFNGKTLNYGGGRQLLDFLPSLACGATMFLTVVLCQAFVLNWHSVAQLIALVSVGVIFYSIFSLVAGVPEAMQAIATIKQWFNGCWRSAIGIVLPQAELDVTARQAMLGLKGALRNDLNSTYVHRRREGQRGKAASDGQSSSVRSL